MSSTQNPIEVQTKTKLATRMRLHRFGRFLRLEDFWRKPLAARIKIDNASGETRPGSRKESQRLTRKIACESAALRKAGDCRKGRSFASNIWRWASRWRSARWAGIIGTGDLLCAQDPERRKDRIDRILATQIKNMITAFVAGSPRNFNPEKLRYPQVIA
jgi:hypothetical protein